ncbi:hypothetical protein LOAG_16871 [Loa loa]|uniref:Uncharacterized protein n=1 Tax=Loa loa TaxID=7209 RepID=A0A1S0UMV0_LOALO|nr:hypothetical protein LOAG_16871 [Loa loa]EJD76134.1 hypothetical protein LOAG_16871 [Loa loa]
MAHNCPLTKGDLELTLPLNLYKYAILFGFIDKTKYYVLRVFRNSTKSFSSSLFNKK